MIKKNKNKKKNKKVKVNSAVSTCRKHIDRPQPANVSPCCDLFMGLKGSRTESDLLVIVYDQKGKSPQSVQNTLFNDIQ